MYSIKNGSSISNLDRWSNSDADPDNDRQPLLNSQMAAGGQSNSQENWRSTRSFVTQPSGMTGARDQIHRGRESMRHYIGLSRGNNTVATSSSHAIRLSDIPPIRYQNAIEAQDALRNAATLGDVETVQGIISGGVQINAGNDYGKTALMYAAQHGHLDVVKMLVKSGANIKAKDSDGDTVLSYYCDRNHMNSLNVGKKEIRQFLERELSVPFGQLRQQLRRR